MKKIVTHTLACAAALVLAFLPASGHAEDVQDCAPLCDGAKCGDDGCGGVCGQCNAYQECHDGVCLFEGGCNPSELPGCGDCSCEACVCQMDPYCCTSAWDAMCVSRCEDACGGCGIPNQCGDGQCTGTESCANCGADCGQCPPECGQVTSIGCCVGDNVLSCQSGTLEVTACNLEEQGSCGWSLETNAYVCGGEGGDPSGDYPPECPTAPDKEIVDGFSPPEECSGLEYSGCCSGKSVFWCDTKGLHSLDCGANPAPFDSCGWNKPLGVYDCGFEGTDPTGENEKACPDFQTDVAADVPEIPKCTVGSLMAVGCQDISFEGCCSQEGALYFCEKGKYLCALHCPDLVAPADVCGWNDVSGWYDCGGDGPDPTGEFPMSCPALQVPTDTAAPDLQTQPATCPGVPEGGCCEDSWLTWCESGLARTFDCSTLSNDPVFGAYTYCGTNPTNGTADCIKKSDPSPPVCSGQPIEPAPDILEVHQDVELDMDILDTSGLADGIGDLVLDGSTDSGSGTADLAVDTSPFIIPTDTNEVEPEVDGNGGGCGCRTTPPASKTTTPGLLLLACAALAVFRCRRRHRQI